MSLLGGMWSSLYPQDVAVVMISVPHITRFQRVTNPMMR